MAIDLNGLIANAFCAKSDIEDVSHQIYNDDSRPSLAAMFRKAETAANDLTLWMESNGYPGNTPAVVGVTSTLAKALRVLNAMTAARDLLRDQHAKDRPTISAAAEALIPEINARKSDLLQYLAATGSGSATALGCHITDGDTVAQDIDNDVQEDYSEYVSHTTRF